MYGYTLHMYIYIYIYTFVFLHIFIHTYIYIYIICACICEVILDHISPQRSELLQSWWRNVPHARNGRVQASPLAYLFRVSIFRIYFAYLFFVSIRIYYCVSIRVYFRVSIFVARMYFSYPLWPRIYFLTSCFAYLFSRIYLKNMIVCFIMCLWHFERIYFFVSISRIYL